MAGHLYKKGSPDGLPFDLKSLLRDPAFIFRRASGY